jgi:hypothetical protein
MAEDGGSNLSSLQSATCNFLGAEVGALTALSVTVFSEGAAAPIAPYIGSFAAAGAILACVATVQNNNAYIPPPEPPCDPVPVPCCPCEPGPAPPTCPLPICLCPPACPPACPPVCKPAPGQCPTCGCCASLGAVGHCPPRGDPGSTCCVCGVTGPGRGPGHPGPCCICTTIGAVIVQTGRRPAPGCCAALEGELGPFAAGVLSLNATAIGTTTVVNRVVASQLPVQTGDASFMLLGVPTYQQGQGVGGLVPGFLS